MDARARGILTALAMLLVFLGVTQPWNHGSASTANGSTSVVTALGNTAAQAAPELNSEATAANALACSLQTDVGVMPLTGFSALPTRMADNHGQSCFWNGPDSTVGADILAQVPADNGHAVDAAFQDQLQFSQNWAHDHPSLGETVSAVPGMLDTYLITDTATHSLAMVTIRPDLGLVVRYTTPHDTAQNRENLFALAA